MNTSRGCTVTDQQSLKSFACLPLNGMLKDATLQPLQLKFFSEGTLLCRGYSLSQAENSLFCIFLDYFSFLLLKLGLLEIISTNKDLFRNYSQNCQKSRYSLYWKCPFFNKFASICENTHPNL